MRTEDSQGMTQPAQTSCFDVYYRAATWIMAFALETSRRGLDTDVGGLSLSVDEMDAIQLPMVEILAALSGERPPADGPPIDLEYWRSAIHQFTVCGQKNQILHCHPGKPIPKNTRLHMVEFGRSVDSVPFECIVANIEDVARLHGIPASELLFTYRGAPIGDVNQLVCEVQLRPCNIKRLTNMLDQWRKYAKRQGKSTIF